MYLAFFLRTSAWLLHCGCAGDVCVCVCGFTVQLWIEFTCSFVDKFFSSIYVSICQAAVPSDSLVNTVSASLLDIAKNFDYFVNASVIIGTCLLPMSKVLQGPNKSV
jgi:hypothetical protein